jgi:hypothetical protein
MNKDWQDWAQWLGSVVLIPLLAVVVWQVFQNKSDIAVSQVKQGADHEMIREIRDDVKDTNRYIMGLINANAE